MRNLPYCPCKLDLVTWHMNISGPELAVFLALDLNKLAKQDTYLSHLLFLLLPHKIALGCIFTHVLFIPL